VIASGAVNGLDAISFIGSGIQGSGRYLINSTAGGSFTSDIGEIFAVIMPSGGNTTQQTFQTIFSSADQGTSTTYIISRLQLNGSSFNHAFFERAANTDDGFRAGAVFQSGVPYIIRTHTDDTTLYMDINGSGQALTILSGANNGDWFSSSTLRDNFALGVLRSNSLTSWFAGSICEILIFDGRTLNGSKKQILTNHLAAKWRVTL
jgi:hypothetical protein